MVLLIVIAENREGALELRWLPEKLPSQVKIILTVIEHSIPHAALQQR